MEAHSMIIESNEDLVSPLSRDSFSRSHGHLYRWEIRVSVPHRSHVWSELLIQLGVGKATRWCPEKNYRWFEMAASRAELR